MPEVVRGSRPSVDMTRSRSGHSDQIPTRTVHFGPESPLVREEDEQPLEEINSGGSRNRRKSTEQKQLERRSADRPGDRPPADAYYDSRAATKREFKRRASTLQDYYREHPQLLPQLPFTFKHGWRRWKLFALIFLIFVDACVVPLVLYYAMKFAGNVEGYISTHSSQIHTLFTNLDSLRRRGNHLGWSHIRRVRSPIMASHQERKLLPAPRCHQSLVLRLHSLCVDLQHRCSHRLSHYRQRTTHSLAAYSLPSRTCLTHMYWRWHLLRHGIECFRPACAFPNQLDCEG